MDVCACEQVGIHAALWTRIAQAGGAARKGQPIFMMSGNPQADGMEVEQAKRLAQQGRTTGPALPSSERPPSAWGFRSSN